MNYGELKTTIQNYVQNSESTFQSEIDNFVKTAEDRIYRTVQIPSDFKQTSELPANSVNEKALGAGVIEIYSVESRVSDAANGPWTNLLRKDYDFLTEAFPDTNVTSTAGPKFYAVSSASVTTSNPNLTILLAPKTPANCDLRVNYYGKVDTDSITSGNDTKETWISVTFPDVLLYGSLSDAYSFMKGEPTLVQFYEQRFAESLATMAGVITGEQTMSGPVQ
jgi:hypothetical protein